MKIEILDSMMIGGSPVSAGGVVEVSDDFGTYQIALGRARKPEPAPAKAKAAPAATVASEADEAAPEAPRRRGGRRSHSPADS